MTGVGGGRGGNAPTIKPLLMRSLNFVLKIILNTNIVHSFVNKNNPKPLNLDQGNNENIILDIKTIIFYFQFTVPAGCWLNRTMATEL